MLLLLILVWMELLVSMVSIHLAQSVPRSPMYWFVFLCLDLKLGELNVIYLYLWTFWCLEIFCWRLKLGWSPVHFEFKDSLTALQSDSKSLCLRGCPKKYLAKRETCLTWGGTVTYHEDIFDFFQNHLNHVFLIKYNAYRLCVWLFASETLWKLKYHKIMTRMRKKWKKSWIFVFLSLRPPEIMAHLFLVIFMKYIPYIFTPSKVFGIKLVISSKNFSF